MDVPVGRGAPCSSLGSRRDPAVELGDLGFARHPAVGVDRQGGDRAIAEGVGVEELAGTDRAGVLCSANLLHGAICPDQGEIKSGQGGVGLTSISEDEPVLAEMAEHLTIGCHDAAGDEAVVGQS